MTAAKELLMHVGHGKTGSSFLQSVFALSTAELLTAGIFYPGSTKGVAAAAQGKISSGNCRPDEDLAALLEQSAADRVLVSNEVFFNAILSGRVDLAGVVGLGHTVKVLLYIRDPLDHLASVYGQRVKRTGLSQSFSEFAERPNIAARALQFLDMMDELAIDVKVINYSRHRDDLVDTAAAWLGVQSEQLGKPEQKIVNRSLTRSELELQRLFNHHIGEGTRFISDRWCNKLPDVQSEAVDIPTELLESLKQKYQPSIDKVNARIPNTEHYHFPDSTSSPQDASNEDTSEYVFTGDQLKVFVAGIANHFEPKNSKAKAQAPNNADPDAPRRVAFVAGVARSGTTALTELLNRHPEIAIGIERYKFLFLKDGTPDPTIFDQDRFFTFEPTDSNINPATSFVIGKQYEAIEKKYASAAVVGDKIPNLSRCYGQINDMFDNARIIHVVREPTAVARSWERRANNEKDSWPADVGTVKSITRWVADNKRALDFYRQHPKRILFVSYEAIFSEEPQALELICEFLGVDVPTKRQHKDRLKGAEVTAGKQFTDLGSQPEGVTDEKWAQVGRVMGRLQNAIRP